MVSIHNFGDHHIVLGSTVIHQQSNSAVDFAAPPPTLVLTLACVSIHVISVLRLCPAVRSSLPLSSPQRPPFTLLPPPRFSETRTWVILSPAASLPGTRQDGCACRNTQATPTQQAPRTTRWYVREVYRTPFPLHCFLSFGYVRSGRGRLRQGAETRATGQNHKWSNNPARDAGWGNGDRGRQDCGGHGGLVTGRPTRAGAGVGELQLVSCPDSELDPRDGGWLYTPFLSSLSTSG